MKEKTPFLIGIAGGSCSGKTTIIESLKAWYGNNLTTLMFDDYIYSKEEIDYSKVVDWERIDLYDLKRLIADLARIKNGEVVVYSSNSRESTQAGIKKKVAEPKPLVVIEGFLLLANPEIRKQLDLMIFLDIPEEEMLQRRFARRIEGNPWDSEKYIHTYLVDGHRKNVLPTKVFAHHILDATKSPEELISEIDGLVRRRAHYFSLPL